MVCEEKEQNIMERTKPTEVKNSEVKKRAKDRRWEEKGETDQKRRKKTGREGRRLVSPVREKDRH